MNSGYLKKLEPSIVQIAEQAGKVILRVYEENAYTVTEKPDHSPVTEADLAAHTLIAKCLEALPFDFPVLSEEVSVPFSTRQLWQTYWLVDPLDGTKEFIKRNGEFGVNIALVHESQSILGVVHAPVFNKTYVGSRGNGAWKVKHHNDKPSKAEPLKTKPASDPKRITFSRSHSNPSDRMRGYLEALGDTEVVRMGSSLKSCLVAEGRADLYPRMGATCEWDTAACQIIVEEAGGVLCDFEGQPLRYNTKDSLINPEFIVYGDKNIEWLKEEMEK